MRMQSVLGVVLLAVGVAILAGSGLRYRSRGDPVHMAGMEISVTRSHVVPPILGGLALLGGVALLAVGARRPA